MLISSGSFSAGGGLGPSQSRTQLSDPVNVLQPSQRAGADGNGVQGKKAAGHLMASVSISPDVFQSIKPQAENQQVASMSPGNWTGLLTVLSASLSYCPTVLVGKTGKAPQWS